MKPWNAILALLFAVGMLSAVGCEPEDELPSGLSIRPTGKVTAYQFGKGVVGEFNPGVDVQGVLEPDPTP